jgi:hypothetical protein
MALTSFEQHAFTVGATLLWHSGPIQAHILRDFFPLDGVNTRWNRAFVVKEE